MARSPWLHITVTGPSGSSAGEPVAGEGAQLDGDRAGEVAVGDLAGLADIQHHAGLVVEPLGLDHREPGLGEAGGSPGGHAAGQLAHQVVVADGAALAGQLPAVLVLVQDEHQRPGVVDAASPASWRTPGAARSTAPRGCGRRRTR